MKRIICLILAVLLLCPTLALATATKAPKKDYYAKKGTSASSASSKYAPRDNDIMLYTFTDVASGSLPGGITASGSYGEVTTAEYDVDGRMKNCLVLKDTDSSDANNGVRATISAGGKSGKVGVEYRFMYIPDQTSGWVNFTSDFYGAKGYMSRFMIHSTTGMIRLNNTGAHNVAFEKVVPNTWYTISFCFDLENNVVDSIFLNEASKKKVTTFDADALNINETLNDIRFDTLRYGGELVFDYIRIYEAEEMLSQIEDTTIAKGTTQIKKPAPIAKPVEGRINLSVDGEIKYTTAKPYVSESGNVMVTAKNLALMMGLKYTREGSVYTLENDKAKIVVDMASNTCQVNGKKTALKEAAALDGLQVYLPAESVASILGAEYAYDAGAELVTITTNPEGGNK